MKARILIIEDEPDLARLVSLYLERDGLDSVIAGSGEIARDLLQKESFDLLLLDINLPGMDGFEFLQWLRPTNPVPVIVVSARETDEDAVLGLGIGADEFIVKPVPPRVLVAHVRALLRRVRQTVADSNVLHFGTYTLDTEAYLLERNGQRISLSGKEFDILIFLAKHPGKAFSSRDIYESVWGQSYGDLTIVGVYVQRIRRKIEDDPQVPQYLETVYGKGYRFSPNSQGGE